MNRDRGYPHPGPLYGGPIFPGNGYPPNPGEDRPGLSAFGRLAKGQPLGKSSILIYDNTRPGPQPAAVNMITVEGDDLDAQQLVVTLAPPRVIPQAFANLQIDQQNLSGEQTNAEVTSGNFPGVFAPMAWPPLEAIVEWGVRGAQAQAVIDYVNGVTFSVSASYLRVSAVVTQSDNTGDISGTSAAYYLAAFVGPGFAANGTAQRTVYVGTIGAGLPSAVFDIPRFAKRAYLFGADNAAVPATTSAVVRYWQSPTGAASGTNVGNVVVTGGQPLPFEIPSAASYFSVINNSAVPLKIGVVFELAF